MAEFYKCAAGPPPKEAACDAYCGLVTQNCTGDNALDFGDATCKDACMTWTPGTQDDTTGDTIGCRIYHAGVAGTDEDAAKIHCPHASPDGGGVCVDAKPTVCDAYCAMQEKNCTDENAIDFGDKSCADACGSWAEGAPGDASGNTAHCRLYHASDPAANDPAVHCPHASPDGGGVCVDAEPTVCETYCATQAKNCTGENAIDFGDKDCAEACGSWAEGTEGDTSGNTTHCRLYHAGDPASKAPEVHCPHASPDGGGVCVD